MAQIQLKRGQSVNIAELTLQQAEPAFTLDTGKLYIGDGEKNVLINPDKVASAGTADKLAEAKQFSVTGDVTAPAVDFDGSGNVVLNASLSPSGVTAGSHIKVTVNDKGIVTGGGALEETDIPQLGAAKITETEDKKFISNAEKEKITGIDAVIEAGDTFHTDMVTVSSLGGIAAGEDLNSLSIEQVLTKLLYPYVAPSVSVSALAVNGGVFEKGNNQTVTSIKALVTKKSEKINKIEIFDGAKSLGVKDGEVVQNGGTFTFQVEETVSANKAFTVKVTDAKEKIVQANTGSFNFVYPYFMGVVADGVELTEGLVEGLNKKVEAKGNKSHAFNTNNQRMVFAYPKSHGAIRQIIDPNNFDVTGTFARTELNITGLDETEQAYYVYVNNASTVSNFTIKFNY